MNEFAVLVVLPTKADLGADAVAERSKRLHAIMSALFSLGPAWHGNADTVLLKTHLEHRELVERICPLVEESDFIAVLELSAKVITTIGASWEPDDLEALHPDVVKLGVSPSGGTYPIS